MWVRLTSVKIKPEKMDDCRGIMIEEIIPIVKAQKGNIDCCLLESVEERGDAISYSSWETKEDGDSYEASGTKSGLFARAPVEVKNIPRV